MKTVNANAIRAQWVKFLMEAVGATEDIGQIASNSFNFPVVVDGEEGWVEIVVKVPKENGDEGYDKRVSYEIALKEKEEKEKAKAEAKAKKIAKDKTKKEAEGE